MSITVHTFDGGGSVWWDNGGELTSAGIIELGCYNYGIATRDEEITIQRGKGKINGEPVSSYDYDEAGDTKTISRGTEILIEVEGYEAMFYICKYGPQVFDWDFTRQVEEFDISVRAYNALKNANILTFGELVRKTEKEMLDLENFGRKSLTEIKEALAYSDLKLGMTESDMLLWTIKKEKKLQQHR